MRNWIVLKTKLKLFLRLSNCASIGEKNLIIIKLHSMYMKIIKAQQARLCNSYKNTKLKLLTKLKLFLTLSNCASVGEKTLIIVKMHGLYVKIMR